MIINILLHYGPTFVYDAPGSGALKTVKVFWGERKMRGNSEVFVKNEVNSELKVNTAMYEI